MNTSVSPLQMNRRVNTSRHLKKRERENPLPPVFIHTVLKPLTTPLAATPPPHTLAPHPLPQTCSLCLLPSLSRSASGAPTQQGCTQVPKDGSQWILTKTQTHQDWERLGIFFPVIFKWTYVKSLLFQTNNHMNLGGHRKDLKPTATVATSILPLFCSVFQNFP